jgi:YD repeat-containing protein
MQGLLRRAVTSIVAVSLLAPQGGAIPASARPSSVAYRAPAAFHAPAVALASPPQRIAVKEPVRVKPVLPAASTMRAHVVAGIRASGVRGNGPAMLRPREIDNVLAAARKAAAVFAASRRSAIRPAPPAPAVPVANPASAAVGARPGPIGRRVQSLPSDSNASGTGINPWWRYQEQNVPGGGHVMVNVGTGNLLLQDDDMSVPHKGIALAFRRTYNSQSGHDVNATDAAGFAYEPPGMYGNGWTNTFDAHIARNAALTVYTIFDIDGARYDYDATWPTGNPNGIFTPRAGNHAMLTYDGACGYLWTKKSGTTYYFYAPGPHAPCTQTGGTTEGYAGRLYQIVGRNRNTYLTFTYSWDGGISSLTGKVSQISVQTESGQTATLAFSDVNGHRLLSQITYPDVLTTVFYGYDGQGNLTWVSSPPNNSAGTRPITSYGYQAVGSGSAMQYVGSPRWNAGCSASGGCGSDGGILAFTFAGSSNTTSTLSSIWHEAVVNPPINDGTNTPLQQNYAPTALWYWGEYYTTGVTTPTYRDTDGHMTNWVVDGAGRPTQTQECTASLNQGQQCADTLHWLTTNESWDANNSLTAEIDQRGYETDYAYDANGNTVAVAAPLTTVTTPGGIATFRPTELYDYDQFNNLVAFCDQRATHPRGDWGSSGPPTSGGPDALCSTNGSSAHAVFTFPINPAPAYEPFGQLTNIRSPLGYNRAIKYELGPQGGTDYSLPTAVLGDFISQPDGGRQPFQSFTYDSNGRLICATTSGNDATTTTILANDVLGRVTAVGDPDDSALTNASCTKQPGIAGSAIVSRKTYYPDGSIATSQTPSEAAANVSTQFQYDLDGNGTTEVHHYTNTPGTTTKWYDGADRLVEVRQPTDPLDFYQFPWLTRYLYDLTQGGTVTVATSPTYSAYGNLYKTQELLPTGVPNPQWAEPGSVAGPSAGNSNPSWQDTAGTAFDALDRAATQYRNTGSSLMPVTSTYDAPGSRGLLSQRCNANSECQSFTYDERGLKLQSSFNVGSSTTQTFGYDENGRIASATNAVGSITDNYDADGRKTIRTEAVGAQSATISNGYYGDGQRSSTSITTPTQLLTNALTYTYSPSNLVRSVIVGSTTFGFSYTGGGRLTSRTDTTGQAADTFTYANPSTTPTSYGLVLSINTPGFYETGITYNAGGRQLAGSVYAWNGSGWYPDASILNTYTSRDELSANLNANTLFANGMPIQTSYSLSSSISKTAYFQFNAFQSYPIRSNSANTCGAKCEENDTASLFTYDAAGRQVQFGPDPNSNGSEPGLQNSKTYDAEDHLLSEALPSIQRAPKTTAFQQVLGYRWGPLGHPLQVGSTSPTAISLTPPSDFQYDTLFWDEDEVLFTVNAAGQIDDIKVADFADYVPGASAPLTVWDRDINGQTRGCHNAQGAGNANSLANQNPPLFCSAVASTFTFPTFGGNSTAVGRGGMLLIQKDDGFSDGQNTFQGVRTYDPQAGVWTTPDAYHGDVHDPMSQKPYMWNRNNPYEYSDPSGYCFEDLCVGEALFALGLALLRAAATNGPAITAEMAAPGGGAAAGVPTRTLVIGKVAELGELGANETSLLPRLTPKLATPKANWLRNAGALREEMAKGKPIRDAHVTADGELIKETQNTFLNAERKLLEDRGWTYDKQSRTWKPPAPRPAPVPAPPPKPK